MDLVWVIKAEYVSDFKVDITFNNGIRGVVDFEGKFDLPIYEPLLDLGFFKSFKLNSWTIEWENGADFAPEYLYELVIRLKESSSDKVYA